MVAQHGRGERQEKEKGKEGPRSKRKTAGSWQHCRRQPRHETTLASLTHSLTPAHSLTPHLTTSPDISVCSSLLSIKCSSWVEEEQACLCLCWEEGGGGGGSLSCSCMLMPGRNRHACMRALLLAWREGDTASACLASPLPKRKRKSL